MENRIKIKLKSGDLVKIISGKSKGGTGKIVKIFPNSYRAIVDGMQLVTKHVKPTQNSLGDRIQVESSIHISNLMMINPSTDAPARVGRRVEGNKIVRFFKKSKRISIQK